MKTLQTPTFERAYEFEHVSRKADYWAKRRAKETRGTRGYAFATERMRYWFGLENQLNPQTTEGRALAAKSDELWSEMFDQAGRMRKGYIRKKTWKAREAAIRSIPGHTAGATANLFAGAVQTGEDVIGFARKPYGMMAIGAGAALLFVVAVLR